MRAVLVFLLGAVIGYVYSSLRNRQEPEPEDGTIVRGEGVWEYDGGSISLLLPDGISPAVYTDASGVTVVDCRQWVN